MTPQSAKSKGKYKHAADLQDYFEQRVRLGLEDQCWTFGTKGDKNGYPQVTGGKHCKEHKLTRAHQVAYYLYKGPIPADKIVCHACDNPACVNPEHLFLGTWDDNVQDMMRKGRYRHPSTTSSWKRKITEEQLKEILAAKGVETCMKLAPKYNVSYSYIAWLWRKHAA